MSEEVRLRRPPSVGAWVPGYLVRIVFLLLATVLCLDRFAGGFWLVVGILLAVLAAAFPRTLAAWAVVVLLGVSQLYRHPAVFDLHFPILLAGLHLLHLLAAQMLALPALSRVQLIVFARPLIRFLSIQVPVQAIACIVLSWPVPAAAHRWPVFVVVAGALALLLLTLLLSVPLLRERPR